MPSIGDWETDRHWIEPRWFVPDGNYCVFRHFCQQAILNMGGLTGGSSGIRALPQPGSAEVPNSRRRDDCRAAPDGRAESSPALGAPRTAGAHSSAHVRAWRSSRCRRCPGPRRLNPVRNLCTPLASSKRRLPRCEPGCGHPTPDADNTETTRCPGRVDDEGPRGRPGGQRARPGRHPRERRRAPGDLRPGRVLGRVRGRLAG